MQPARVALTRPIIQAEHICLSCRLKLRRAHNGRFRRRLITTTAESPLDNGIPRSGWRGQRQIPIQEAPDEAVLQGKSAHEEGERVVWNEGSHTRTMNDGVVRKYVVVRHDLGYHSRQDPPREKARKKARKLQSQMNQRFPPRPPVDWDALSSIPSYTYSSLDAEQPADNDPHSGALARLNHADHTQPSLRSHAHHRGPKKMYKLQHVFNMFHGEAIYRHRGLTGRDTLTPDTVVRTYQPHPRKCARETLPHDLPSREVKMKYIYGSRMDNHGILWHQPSEGKPLSVNKPGSPVRKQLGMPRTDKLKAAAEEEERGREGVLTFIDFHQAAMEGVQVDTTELRRHLEAARIWDQSAQMYRPLKSDELEGFRQRISNIYTMPMTEAERDALHRQTAEVTQLLDSDMRKQLSCRDMFEQSLGTLEGGPETAIDQPGRYKPSSWEVASQIMTAGAAHGTPRSASRFATSNYSFIRPPGSASSLSNMFDLQSASTSSYQSFRPSQARLYHTTRRLREHAAAATAQSEELPLPAYTPFAQPNIRTRLRQWQEIHGKTAESNYEDPVATLDNTETGINPYGRLPDSALIGPNTAEADDEEREAEAHFMRASPEEAESTFDSRFMQMGDLVELERRMEDRESMLAIYIRRLGPTKSQFLTSTGRWLLAVEREVPYSIPGFVSPEKVAPLLQFIPNWEDMAEHESMQGEEDLSIPRHITAPLVKAMVEFEAETRKIYRNNASVLDNAHNILAHDTDLRYGSLMAAAVTLLQTPAAELPVTALYTVRSALKRAGFAFNIDRRSHRITGYLQIRSKEQVRMVESVRTWIRDWQDDVAKRAAGDVGRRYKTPDTAKHVYGFIEKVRSIILEQRQNDREPAPHGTVGPSKKRFPILPGEDCIKVYTKDEFTPEEQDIIRFFEACSCSNLFDGLPRLLALPPLVLQATGLYEQFALTDITGFVFLQELGVIMPYENRVRFDQNLLLPTSQHSKPLQKLMTNLISMSKNPDFHDSMKELRRDWKDMPVFCIDEANAQEIDDGISVEPAGEGLWWVHVHVANPTAFFERDHPAAKMARHMGESLYLPERTYTMLPKWASLRHFSLGKDRPCLTFSMKLDSEGRVRENKIEPGMIRNAISLTKEEVNTAIGMASSESKDRITFTVGGEPPPTKMRKSRAGDLTDEHVEQLKTLYKLSQKMQEIRRSHGGVFFQMAMPEIEVWQSYTRAGLAWDHPWRWGRRVVEGDPVIRMNTQPMTNWFSSVTKPAHSMVMEIMLAAGSVAAMWCAERQIPIIHRGTMRAPNRETPEHYYRETLAPAIKADGEWPMHLGNQYVKLIGLGVMRTHPVWHGTLGLPSFAKVTSPLRRYGDMIVHWQIEGALREEARRGKCLVTDDKHADRSFLPFSRAVLETIMVGLQPREAMITNSKYASIRFWISMVMMRAFHYGECELPFATPVDPSKPNMTVWVRQAGDSVNPKIETSSIAFSRELNLQIDMRAPTEFGLTRAMIGDVWEVEFEQVNVWHRKMVAKPVRLIYREEVPVRM